MNVLSRVKTMCFAFRPRRSPTFGPKPKSNQPVNLFSLLTMRIRSIPPGPEVGRIKQKLEELVIDGEIAPGTQALIDYLSAHPDL